MDTRPGFAWRSILSVQLEFCLRRDGNFLRVLCVFLRVLCEPRDCTIRGFTKNTKGHEGTLMVYS